MKLQAGDIIEVAGPYKLSLAGKDSIVGIVLDIKEDTIELAEEMEIGQWDTAHPWMLDMNKLLYIRVLQSKEEREQIKKAVPGDQKPPE